MEKAAHFLHSILSVLPDQPGVYQFFDKQKKVIYVGKAKSLKKRVNSYFHVKHDNGKTRTLVANIHDIQYIVVDSESDALLLENNLIKQYQPRYNVRLKDDKSFPWIVIKHEPFPRVFYTRNLINDGSQYFGPYTSTLTVKTILGLVRKLFPLRTCKYKLHPDAIKNHKFKVCLEYHIGNCLGPCEGLQSEESYRQGIIRIQDIIRGNTRDVVSHLISLMHQYADAYQFEQAQQVKEKVDILKNFQSRSTIVNPSISNVDVFTFLDAEPYAYVNYMKIIHGAIVQVHSVELMKQVDESKEDLLSTAIIRLRERLHSKAPQILLPFSLDYSIPHATCQVPVRGDKKKLVDLSLQNARHFKKESLERRLQAGQGESKEKQLLQSIQQDLIIPSLPIHMECFDNSNIQGTNPVASCVVFKNGKPSKKEYRHYHIKTVSGPDDYASMKEVVYRRYHRLLADKQALPQLIIVDGGKGQLSAAYQVLCQLNIENQVAIIGIAKKLEELFKPQDSVPLYIDKGSQTLKVIQYMRNEAHRFAITFHRQVRSAHFIQSELDDIPGIGPKSLALLLDHFKDVPHVKKAKLIHLQKLLGKNKGEIVYRHFHLGS